MKKANKEAHYPNILWVVGFLSLVRILLDLPATLNVKPETQNNFFIAFPLRNSYHYAHSMLAR